MNNEAVSAAAEPARNLRREGAGKENGGSLSDIAELLLGHLAGARVHALKDSLTRNAAVQHTSNDVFPCVFLPLLSDGTNETRLISAPQY